jgi:hypothetical protein
MADRILNLGPNHRIRIDDTNNVGYIEFYNNVTGVWQSILQFDTANSKTLLKLSKDTQVEFDIIVPVIVEVSRQVAADSTGVKWTSVDLIPPVLNYVSVAIEATWTASTTDSVTAIELYDATAAVVKASVSGNAGTNVKSSYVSLTPGNKHNVRINVTTASATAGATATVTKALLYFKVKIS